MKWARWSITFLVLILVASCSSDKKKANAPDQWSDALTEYVLLWHTCPLETVSSQYAAACQKFETIDLSLRDQCNSFGLTNDQCAQDIKDADDAAGRYFVCRMGEARGEVSLEECFKKLVDEKNPWRDILLGLKRWY
jgi:hypothetical protein